MPRDGVTEALHVASAHFGVSVADIRSQRRTRYIHPARVWGIYLASMTTDVTAAEIGKRFGRDEAIVRMYARACARQVARDENAARLFGLLKDKHLDDRAFNNR